MTPTQAPLFLGHRDETSLMPASLPRPQQQLTHSPPSQPTHVPRQKVEGGGAVAGVTRADGDIILPPFSDEDGEGNLPSRRPAGRSGARQSEEERGQNNYALKEEAGQRKFNTLLVKSLLNSLQRCRDFEGAILDVGLVGAEHKVIQGARQGGKIHAEKCRENGRGHSNGPPHTHAFMRFLSDLLELVK